MRFGYNTNGFAHHRLEDALVILAELGYESVAITLDYHALNPFAPDLPARTNDIRTLLKKYRMRCVIETGTRFLLDPRRKHQPTLISPSKSERDQRFEFLKRAIDIAAELEADAVSFWSGAPVDGASFEEHMRRLVEECRRLCDVADKKPARLAFEPEPGMLIDTMDKFASLRQAVVYPMLGLTIDIGHLHCQGEIPISEHLQDWKHCLWNVHIEDMRRGVHEHLMFGQGEIDFPPVLRTLREIGYEGGVHVELSRHSHDAVATARKSLAFLQGLN